MERAAADKIPHSLVLFEHPSKHAGKRCGNCEHFIPPYHPGLEPRCEAVRDPIREQDYCKRWEAKK